MKKGDRVRETEKSGRVRPRTGLVEDIATFRVGGGTGKPILKIRWNDGHATFHTLPDDRIEKV